MHIQLLHLVDFLFICLAMAFDKIWHEGLIFKLKSMGIFCFIRSSRKFLKTTKFKVVLNGQTSITS